MVMRSSLIFAAALVTLAFGAYGQQTNKVGVISVQGAIVGTKDGQKASQELEAKFSPKKKDIDGRNAEISQLEDQLRKGGSVMSRRAASLRVASGARKSPGFATQPRSSPGNHVP